jgi:hypothetical protein
MYFKIIIFEFLTPFSVQFRTFCEISLPAHVCVCVQRTETTARNHRSFISEQCDERSQRGPGRAPNLVNSPVDPTRRNSVVYISMILYSESDFSIVIALFFNLI